MSPPSEKGNGEMVTRRVQIELPTDTDDCIAAGFAQATAAIAELRRCGVLFGVFAIHFDEQREQLREQIEALVREKAIERRRKELLIWTQHAQALALEFGTSGDWRHCRALLQHVLAMRQRLKESTHE